jgi:DNA modification methylase
MEIIHRLPSELRGYERNARTHSAEQVKQIAASITSFGFNNPLLIDGSGMVLAGHGRLEAALQLGLATVPCVVLDHMTPEQQRAYILADNKLALNAGWDEDLLRMELGELQAAGLEMFSIGFNGSELNLMFREGRSGGLTDPDDLPDPQDQVVSEVGDLWLLGRHRLRCGSSTSATDVAALLGEGVPELMITDPPYGVEYDASWRGNGGAIGKVLNDDRADWEEAWRLFPGDVAYVWHGGSRAAEVQCSLERCSFSVRAQIIWAKSQLVISRGHYHSQHEPCFYVVRKGKTASWTGGRKQTTTWRCLDEHLRQDELVFVRRQAETGVVLALSGDESTVWEIDKPSKSETGHSTQKPVECMLRPMRNHRFLEVYEPFSGSGTTLIAAEMAGKKCYAMELHPPYVDLAVTRWQNFTGKQAIHAVTGCPFGT